MDAFNNLIVAMDDLVWGLPLIILIFGCGLWLTIRTFGVQFFHLGKALKYMVKNETDGVGEVSSFAALCTALSATIGTGNIVGVATAICAGGPGALFWMEIAAILGMATKYAEGFLAIRYRTMENGRAKGGPFYYIERGMGASWGWLAKLFAVFTILAGLMGIGTITQINGITSAAQTFFDPDKTNVVFTMGGVDITMTTVVVGLLVTAATALVVIGGIKRIAHVAEIVVPFMAVIYFALGLLIIACNISSIPDAFYQIVVGAFSPEAVGGGAIGATISIAMQKGVGRGIFSNEAGLGSAAIAAAAAQTKDPVRQGLVTMTGTFLDTIVICTITGLSIVMTGAWLPENGVEGAAVTMLAFERALPFSGTVSSFLLMACLVFFAFTTILGWDFYAERAMRYLVGDNEKVIKAFHVIYVAAVFVGPYLTVAVVWNMASVFNGLMAFPNLIALFALSGVIGKETVAYFKDKK
ncbi:sodium:alanine symporter family protein [Bengtsoniella intestinalis]|uniref:alanine/glycine:cation symporter family protein n=1 Tax=Bengtsoniella intestinalis TaxID=3073143 RepID=UPI00391F9834